MCVKQHTHRGVVQVHTRGPGAVVLHEGPDEAQPKGSLKQELGLPLVLGQTKECHIPEVLLGRVQEELSPLLLRDRGHVVAAHQTQVGQHAHLRTGKRGGGVRESRDIPVEHPAEETPGFSFCIRELLDYRDYQLQLPSLKESFTSEDFCFSFKRQDRKCGMWNLNYTYNNQSNDQVVLVQAHRC